MLDSEPDDDDSDDESRPKHEIPNWAQSMYLKESSRKHNMYDFMSSDMHTDW